jgi:hypothetical protein
MSNLKAKADRLYRKTHTFFSYRSLVLIRRYYKAKAESVLRTPAFVYNKSIYTEINKKINDSPLLEYFEEAVAMMEKEPAVRWEHSLVVAERNCKNHPNGMWIKNSDADTVAFYNTALTNAKKFFGILPPGVCDFFEV